MTSEDPNHLNPAEIDAALAGSPFHGRLHHFATIGSTSTHALEQARKGARHGSFYVADEQTAGRGRGGNHWHSVAGDGLYVSILLRPAIAPPQLVWLPLLAGLAAHRAIQETTGLTADLRWPNDLLIGTGSAQRKTGGILVESQLDSGRVGAAVIGIGINLHQQEFPRNLATPATSLDLETGRCTSRQQLLIELLGALHSELANLGSEAALTAIPARIGAISSWIKDRKVHVHGPQECTGITAGLDAQGFLRVMTATGEVTITTGGLRDAIR